MPYFVVAYPQLDHTDFDQIQQFRQIEDLQYHLIKPHFTLVFNLPDDKDQLELVNEVRQRCEGFQSFNFCLRCVTLNRDAFKPVYHIFLVPDEGNSEIIRLHDRLYSGALFGHRSLDIDYIPHITIGSSQSVDHCLNLIDQWNAKRFEIWGSIHTIELIQVKDQVETIKTIELDR